MKKNIVKILDMQEKYMASVISLLQSISQFKPNNVTCRELWDSFEKQTNVFSVVAVIDERVVGYGSIFIITMVRGGKVAHIEDIVTHDDFQKMGIGRTIIQTLNEIALNKSCYKAVLECKENTVSFYEKCGYSKDGLTMSKKIG